MTAKKPTPDEIMIAGKVCNYFMKHSWKIFDSLGDDEKACEWRRSLEVCAELFSNGEDPETVLNDYAKEWEACR